MIFETERLLVRKLNLDDLSSFHALESNAKVLQYAEGNVKSFSENRIELYALIEKYNDAKNNFWIYAVITKDDEQFIGTLAFVKDKKEDEIGYRFLEESWGFGYGSELCKGLVLYAKRVKYKKLIAYVDLRNVASYKILEKAGFTRIANYSHKTNKLEIKYEYIL